MDKFTVLARNEHLVQLAEKEIGKTTAFVYRELLRLVERDAKACKLEDQDDDDEGRDVRSSMTLDTADITAGFSDVGSLSDGIGTASDSHVNISTIHQPRKKRRNVFPENEAEVEGSASPDEDDEEEEEEETNGYDERNISDVDQDEDLVNGHRNYDPSGRSKNGSHGVHEFRTESQQKEYLVRQHLLLLADHHYGFVVWHQRRGILPERWSVPYHSLSRRMRLIELENMITVRYGDEALRLVRILQEKGKLDEKSLASFALMNTKHMRGIMTQMHEGGHLELQEVPRDNQRLPNKTIFLWFWDAERCKMKMLEETYKTMARCMRRVTVERETFSGVLEKANRTDVVGREDELLTHEERNELYDWNEREEKLLGEIGRLDDLVAVLRDF
jgi:DNA-directed RNA polymerase III subunit RPC3